MQVKAHFDGQKIILPPELRGMPAMDVTVVVPSQIEEDLAPQRSWRDSTGKFLSQQRADQIRQELRSMREEDDE